MDGIYHTGNYSYIIAMIGGIETIFCTVLSENEGMLALGRKMGFKISRSAEPGEMELTIDLKSNKFQNQLVLTHSQSRQIMGTEITKSVVVPLDGSENALKTLKYLKLIFGSQHNLDVNLFHAIQGIPPILAEESKSNLETAKQVRELENRNKQLAKKILIAGKKALLDFGFEDDRIQTVEFHKQIGVARDICGWSEKKEMDAIALSTRGRSRIEAFFMGETANKVLEFSRICPVWMVKEDVRLTPVLIALDTSENALRAVDHAAFMLSGTDCEITLFYSKRNLFRFFSISDEFGSLPELENTWQTAAGREIAPTMKKAKQILIQAGIEETQISVRIVDGSHNAASDILNAANRFGCGTIVMGQRGVTGVKEYSMGSVCRKVLQNSNALALWLVP